MKITKSSKKLMSLFLNNKCINYSKTTNKTKTILLQLLDDLKKADAYIKSIQREKDNDGSFYKLSIKKIMTNSQIPKPTLFNSNNFPKEIRNQIEDFSVYHLSYSFSLFQREIFIHFIVEDTNVEMFPEKYNAYVDKILVWLAIITNHSHNNNNKKCSKKLTLFLYMTSLNKGLPNSNITILDQIHVNTAFTHTCPVNSEIVVFRQEEWFKVLMHETFHNFALDFSDMNTSQVNQQILSLFKVNSEVNLFEAYTEFWAEIWNAVFCSFYLSSNNKNNNNKNNNNDFFLKNCDFFINFERTYGFFQMVKALDFMGLQYHDLYSMNKKSVMLRTTLYKERSNILAYYIIKMVLLNNYQGFLSWCSIKNNTSLISFKKTTLNLEQFYNFIEDNYKSRTMLEGVQCMENFLDDLHNDKEKDKDNGKGKNKKKDRDFLLNNMRMTICEMG